MKVRVGPIDYEVERDPQTTSAMTKSEVNYCVPWLLSILLAVTYILKECFSKWRSDRIAISLQLVPTYE